jgi:hypothetical protein
MARIGREEEKPCEDGGRDCSYAVTNQGMPGAIVTGRDKEGVFPEPTEGAQSCFEFGLLASRTLREPISVLFFFFKPLCCGLKSHACYGGQRKGTHHPFDA